MKKYLFVFLVVLVSLEIVIRLLGVAPKIPAGYDIWKSDHRLGFITKPNISQNISLPDEESTFYVKHNSYGFRDDEPVNPQAVFLGDSFVYGWGVDKKDTFVDLVEDSLGIEIMNAGVPGYYPEKEISLYNFIPFHFEQVFIVVTPGDLADGGTHIVSDNGKMFTTGVKYLRYLYDHSHICRIILKKISIHYSLSIPENKKINFKKLIDDFALYDKAKVIIINNPSRYQLPEFKSEQLNITLAKECYFKEGHLNKKGHEEVSKLIIEWLDRIKNQK